LNAGASTLLIGNHPHALAAGPDATAPTLWDAVPILHSWQRPSEFSHG
jgi:hypothetical protein